MNISAKLEYGCVAMLELARQYETGEPVQIRRIAEKHGIPQRFLVQILLQLKSAGLVSSTRGASGGYRLLHTPSEVSLRDVFEAIEGPATETIDSSVKPTPVQRALHETWNDVLQLQHQILETTSFADLIERVGETSENMYYI